MKIKKFKNNRITFLGINFLNKSQILDYYTTNLWSSLSNKYQSLLEFKEKNSNNIKTIIIKDNNFKRNCLKSNYFRKVLHLDQKDKDDYIYLVVIPTKKYFKNNFIQKCFKKSNFLINKKYIFLDYYTHRFLLFSCLAQEIFYIKGS
ncbi:hypothetical protein I6E31_05455 [Fusobacterium varium]|nr:hypothetical protein [Fusobacterium varium]